MSWLSLSSSLPLFPFLDAGVLLSRSLRAGERSGPEGGLRVNGSSAAVGSCSSGVDGLAAAVGSCGKPGDGLAAAVGSCGKAGGPCAVCGGSAPAGALQEGALFTLLAAAGCGLTGCLYNGQPCFSSVDCPYVVAHFLYKSCAPNQYHAQYPYPGPYIVQSHVSN